MKATMSATSVNVLYWLTTFFTLSFLGFILTYSFSVDHGSNTNENLLNKKLETPNCYCIPGQTIILC